MSSIPSIALHDGRSIPQIGFGVWRLPEADAPAVVGTALEAGYRHIDTAQGYDNETGVGEAVRNSGIAREALFITSKLRNGHQGFDRAKTSFDESMERLGLDYLDLFLIHWPAPKHDLYPQTWKAFTELLASGRVKSIGVSNFLPKHIERVVAETGVKPVVNQIELHPYYQQRDVRDFHAQHDIKIESYSPLGSGAVLKDETIGAIAKAHGKSIAQVIVRWHLQQGLIVLPKTATPARVPENIDVFDFELSQDETARIDALDRPDGKTISTPEQNNNLF